MEGIFIVLICLAIIPIFLVFYIAHSIQYAKEGQAIFNGHVEEIRAKFLLDVFGLTVDELKQLHFDGYSFHLREKQLYQTFNSVTCIKVQDVKVVNSNLPHSTSWRYTRVDGGPDRRYSNNPATMTSRRFDLRFDGVRSSTLPVYGRPHWGSISEALEKLNTLLAVSHAIDLETKFNKYKTAFITARDSQTLLDNLNAKKAKLESVLAASKRLSSQNALVGDLASQQSEIVAELSRLNSELLQLQIVIATATSQIASLVQSIRKDTSQYKDIQVVQSYRAR